MDNEARPKKSARDLLRIVSRRWSLFLLAASLFAIVILVAAHWVPRKYTGTARFTRRIDPASEQLVNSKSESFETRKLTLEDDLAGNRAVEKVVEGLDLLKSQPRASSGNLTSDSQMAKQELVRKIQAALKVSWEVKSDQVDQVSVAYTDPDPELAQKIPNTLVPNYIAWVGKQSVDRLEASKDFLKQKKDECQSQLNTINAEKIKFETDHAGAMPNSPGVLDDQIRNATRDLDLIQRQLNIADTKLKSVEGRSNAPTTEPSPETMPSSAPTSAPARTYTSPDLERAKAQLREAKDLLETMKTIRGMKEKHPEYEAQAKKIKQLEDEVASLKAQLEAEAASFESQQPEPNMGVRTAVGGAALGPDMTVQIAMIRAEIGALKNQEIRVAARLGDYKKLQMDYAVIAKDYDEINRRLKDKEVEAKKWDDQHLKVQMDLAAESAQRRTQLESIEAAQPQFRPSFPTPLMVLAAALLGGLGFGGLLVFVANALDRTIATSEDAVKCFGVPVHGVIGEIITDKQRRWRKTKRWVLGPCIAMVVVVAIAVAGVTIVLSLNYPEKFTQLKSSPIDCVNSLIRGNLMSGKQI